MDDIKSRLFGATKTVSQVTGDFIKTAKMSMNLANEEDNLKSIYVEIGKKVHEIYMFGGTLGKFFDEKYAEIESCEKRIDEIRNNIDTVKGTKACPRCGKPVSIKSDFCSKCGTKIDPAASEGKLSTEDEIMKTLERMKAADEAELAANEDASHAEPSDSPVPKEPIMQSAAEPEVNPTPMLKCNLCGAENAVGERYCLSCGRML